MKTYLAAASGAAIAAAFFILGARAGVRRSSKALALRYLKRSAERISDSVKRDIYSLKA